MKNLKIYNKIFALALTGPLTFVLVGANINEEEIKDNFNNEAIHQNETTNNIKEIENQVYQALLNNDSVVNVENANLNINQVKQIYLNALINNFKTNPCAVWTPSYRIRNSDNKILEIIMNYDCPLEDLETRRNNYEEKANEIIKLVPKERSDIEKAKILQDLLIQNANYDYNYVEIDGQIFSSSPATTLLEGKAVCSGYARTYADLLNRIGIKAQIVIAADESHCWNVAYLDGNWYHIDITNKACLNNLDFFCKSDEYMEKYYYYPEWTSNVICDDTTYDESLLFYENILHNIQAKIIKLSVN